MTANAFAGDFTAPAHGSARADMEIRAGIESLDLLQAQRAKLIKQTAAMEARYGDGGTWKEHRDALYALLDVEHRDRIETAYAAAVTAAEATLKGSSTRVPKVTEKRVEAAVRSDARWQKALNDWDQGKIALRVAEDAIKQIDERVFSRQAELRYSTAERMGG